jgi:hypothetical protein
VSKEPPPNLVYTLVPLEDLAATEKEIKQCLLELVKLDNPNIAQSSQDPFSSQAIPTTSQVSLHSDRSQTATTTVYVPIQRLQIFHPLFSKLSPDGVRYLLQVGNFITLLPNQILYKEDTR